MRQGLEETTEEGIAETLRAQIKDTQDGFVVGESTRRKKTAQKLEESQGPHAKTTCEAPEGLAGTFEAQGKHKTAPTSGEKTKARLSRGSGAGGGEIFCGGWSGWKNL